MTDIVTLTMNPAVDVSFSVDQVMPEKKLRGSAPVREAGGGGLNVARAVTKLGGRAEAVFLAGGTTGEMLDGLVAAELPARLLIPTRGWTRENVTVWENSTGQQFRFNTPGAALDDSEWLQALDFIRTMSPPPKYLVASGSLPPAVPDDFYLRLSWVARDLGARYVLDTSGEPLKIALDGGGVFLAKPNQGELAALAEDEGGADADPIRLARMIVESGRCEAVMLSLGRAGAVLITRDIVRSIQPPPVAVQSRVGAGDSMVGGIVLALSRGDSLEEAAMYGVAAGTAAAMTPGSELCRREDADRLYARIRSGHGL